MEMLLDNQLESSVAKANVKTFSTSNLILTRNAANSYQLPNTQIRLAFRRIKISELCRGLLRGKTVILEWRKKLRGDSNSLSSELPMLATLESFLQVRHLAESWQQHNTEQ